MEDQMQTGRHPVARAWKQAWRNRRFRTKTIIGSVLFFCILIYLPLFFALIEKRQGILLNDYILHALPAIDVSIPTFLIIWSMTILILVRCTQDPQVLISFLYSFILLELSRMLSITLLPLEAPTGLIVLRDPISSIFYGGPKAFITKDLFYSGHTSVQFLIFLNLTGARDRIVAFIATLCIAILVLIQHIHYTIDVVAAFVFSLLIYRLAKWIAKL